MQNEILKPVLETDETAIPRYDIVNPDGSVTQQNVELRLKNQVMQEGTPYDEESVLPAELATQLGLTATATPAQALQILAVKSYSKDETISNKTKTLFGLGADAVPDDVFLLLGNYIPYPYGLLIVRVSDSNGGGVPARINVSPSIGEVSVFNVSERGFYSILCKPGIYTLTPSETYPFSTVSTGAKQVTVKESIPVVVDFSATKNEHGEYDYTESDEVLVPGFVTDLDLFAVGGGASGECWYASSVEGTSGGAGGYTSTLLHQNLANKVLKIIVGSGGDPHTVIRTASNSGTSTGRHSGGKTSVSVGDIEILSANGAADENGGSGGGKGEAAIKGSSLPATVYGKGGSDGSDGENGGTGQGTTTRKFGESDNTLYASGGGGALYYRGTTATYSGAGTAGPGGGNGTVIETVSTTGTYKGKSATTPGSGGGSLKIGTINSAAYPVTLMSGAGATGMVSLRW